MAAQSLAQAMKTDYAAEQELGHLNHTEPYTADTALLAVASSDSI